MSTHLPGFLSFLMFFASFCIGQISHGQQYKGHQSNCGLPWKIGCLNILQLPTSGTQFLNPSSLIPIYIEMVREPRKSSKKIENEWVKQIWYSQHASEHYLSSNWWPEMLETRPPLSGWLYTLSVGSKRQARLVPLGRILQGRIMCVV